MPTELVSPNLPAVNAVGEVDAGSSGPIGIFDSGFGGLTVARAVIDLLPHEDMVYIGDTGRYPYGDKPAADVGEYARELAFSLVRDHRAKAIVVACNTAAAALPVHELEAELAAEGWNIPVIGVIDPGAQALVRATRTGTVGVIGTIGTIGSRAYDLAVSRASLGAPVKLLSAACPGFVEFVERGRTDGPDVTLLAQRLLAPILHVDIDALLLGCTHYPYLARVISDVVGSGVTLVSSADETAFALREQLELAGLMTDRSERNARHLFLSSGDVPWFKELGTRLLGADLTNVDLWVKS